jgi:hypothetical protein
LINIREYAKGVAAAVTGAVDVGLVGVLDGVAGAETWVTGLALLVANFLGTVVVVKVKNAEQELRDFAGPDSVAEDKLF